MPADINAYALKIAFELEDKVSGTLDVVDGRLGQVEEKISSMATKAMGELNKSSIAMSETLGKMAAEYDKILAASTANVKPVKDSSAISTEAQKRLVGEAAILRDNVLKTWMDITRVLDMKAKQLTEESKLIDKEKGQVEQVQKVLKSWTETIEESIKALQKHLRGIIDIKGAVMEAVQAAEMFKNANFRLYGSQTELVGRANQLASQYGILRREAMMAVHELGNLKVPIEMLDKLTESIVKFNRLSGVSVQQTALWHKQMIAMGLNTSEMERRLNHMAVAMRRFGLDTNDVTSIMRSQQEQAQYLRSVFGDQTAGEIQRAQIAVAAFAKELGATPDVVQKVSAALGSIEFWRLDQLGASVGIASEKMKTAEGQTQAIALASARLAERLRNATTAGERFSLMMTTQGMYGDKLGKAIFDLALQQSRLDSSVKTSSQALELMSKTLQGHGEGVDKLADIYAESNKTLTQQLALLKNAFFSSIGAIWSKVEPFFIMLVQWLNTAAHYIGQVAAAISDFMSTLGPVGSAIQSIAAALMIAVLVFVAFKVVLGGIGFLARLFVAAASTMGTAVSAMLTNMAKGFAAVAPYVPVMWALAALFMAVGLSALFIAIAAAKLAASGLAGAAALVLLTAAMTALAIGVAFAVKFIAVASPVLAAFALTLLAIGAAALMTALAMHIIVDAAIKLASAGSGAVLALFALVAAIALVAAGVALAAGIVLGAAATIAPAVPIILAFGIALLAAGLGALFLAMAVKTMVQFGAAGVIMLGFLVAAVIALAFGIAAAAVVVLGAAAMIAPAAPIILAFAAAILAAGLGALFLAIAIRIMVQTGVGGVVMLGFLTVAIVALAMGVALASRIIGASQKVMIGFSLAILAIGIGAILLAVAVRILVETGVAGIATFVTLGVVMIGLAVAVAFASTLIAAGLPVLIGFSVVLLAVAAAALIISFAIKSMTNSFKDVSVLVALNVLAYSLILAVAGVAMIVAGILLGIGALIMVGAASVLVAAGTVLLTAAILLAPSAVFMAVAGVLYLIAAIALITAFPILMTVGGIMVPTAALLLSGAGSMIAAAIVLFIAGMLLKILTGPIVSASEKLLPAGERFMIIGAGFEKAGIALSVGGKQLRASAWLVRSAGRELSRAARDLNKALDGMSISIVAALKARDALSAAAGAIMSGALSLWVSAFYLNAAVSSMEEPTQRMTTLMTDLADASDKLAGSIGQLIGFAEMGTQLRDSITGIVDALGAIDSIVPKSLTDILTVTTAGANSAALELFATLDVILARVESYGDRMVDSSSRIAQALRAILPSFPLDLFGGGTVKSEAIVTNKTDDASEMFLERDFKREQKRLQEEHNKILKQVSDDMSDIKKTVAKLVAGGDIGAKLVEIIELMKARLPEGGSSGSSTQPGLATYLSEWNR